METADRDAYLARLGFAHPPAPTATALARLQEAHLMRIPFENLSIHLDEPIELDPAWLVEKLTRRVRGGFCFELNGAFAALLETLGFDVELRGARVVETDGRLRPPLDHLALVVQCPADDGDARWLADVGFGDSPLWPARLDGGEPVPDPLGLVELVPATGGDLDLVRAGLLRYRIEPPRRELEDFVPMCWFHRTSPTSPFTRQTVCTRRTDGGRITISGNRLIVTENGERTEHDLPDEAAVLAAYAEHFGIRLDRVPAA